MIVRFPLEARNTEQEENRFARWQFRGFLAVWDVGWHRLRKREARVR